MAPVGSDLTFLLLLPPPPAPASYTSIKAAFERAIDAAIKKVSTAAEPSGSTGTLDIAFQCPTLTRQARNVPRSVLFDPVQQLLAHIYSLISIVSGKAGIFNEFTDGRGGVDARVILLELYDPQYPDVTKEELIGPVIDLKTLADCGRQWSTVYGVDGELGNSLLQAFLQFSGKAITTESLPGSIVMQDGRDFVEVANQNSSASIRHFDVAVGGTFDHLHYGHKLLLTMTLFLLEPCRPDRLKKRLMVVGITNDELLKNKKYADQMFSWDKRAEDSLNFIRQILEFGNRPGIPRISTVSENGPNGHGILTAYADELLDIDCRAISDPFGPTITRQELSGLVISGETRSGGKAVNDKREEHGWASMQVFEVNVLSSHEEADENDFANKISSTEIRKRLHERAT